MNSNDFAQADRRHSDRFPIVREVRYRVLNKRSSEEIGDGKNRQHIEFRCLVHHRTHVAARATHGISHQLAGPTEQ